jgi:hypothetical protein
MSRCEQDASVAIMGRMLRDSHSFGGRTLFSCQGGDHIFDALVEWVAWTGISYAREGLVACSVEC